MERVLSPEDQEYVTELKKLTVEENRLVHELFVLRETKKRLKTAIRERYAKQEREE